MEGIPGAAVPRKSGRSMWKAVAAVIVMAGLTAFTGCRCIGNLFYDHFKIDYRPSKISKDEILPYPDSAMLRDLPRYSDEKRYCQSVVFRMIGSSHGLDRDVRFYNWIMGYTYGAIYAGSFTSFVPLHDPMEGFISGGDYLGLPRTLHSTRSRSVFTDAVKSTVARGIPVAVPIDYNTIAGGDFFFPHIELIVGYDETSFFYLEPGFENLSEEPYEEYGRMDSSLLTEANKSLSRNYGYSSAYFFMTLEEGRPDMGEKELWKYLAENLEGRKIFGDIVNGSLSFESLAEDVEKGKIPDWGWELLRSWFETGSYSRTDNAEFLSETFDDPGLLAASGIFEEESVLFERMLRILDSEGVPSEESAGEIAGLLRGITVNERAAAERFREYAEGL